MTDAETGRRNQPTIAEQTDCATLSPLECWEDEGGRILVAPDGNDESNAGSPPRVRELSQTGGMSTSSERNVPESETHHPMTALPAERADLFTKPLGRFLEVEATSGGALLLATCVAIWLSNSPWSAVFLGFWQLPVGLRFGSLEFSASVQHLLNDGLVTLFFFVVALELKRELVLGELKDWRKAALPFAGAVGGMVVPAAIYMALMADKPGLGAWGTVMATDTAFVIGGLAVLGSRVPSSLRLFLLSLAIFDDVGAVLVVAIGYGEPVTWIALAFATLGLTVVFVAAHLGIRSMFVYILLGGFVWLAFDASGIHPTIAGVVLGLMTPARGWVSDNRLRAIFRRVLAHPRGEHRVDDTEDRADLRQAGRAAREVISPLEQLEMRMHPWVGVAIMPMFALANAGVSMSMTGFFEPVSVAIFASLVVGKPLGVVAGSWLAVRFGPAVRPVSLSWPYLCSGALLTGVGFTMALFIAGIAYSPSLLDAAKTGILGASVVSAATGLCALGWLSRKKQTG